ncbi:SOS response-associated peptidase [Spongiibacter tropicus]|uniref:SOS response-associated peptidase n=1 Tax=Spongiibacter tropicus TaxID=454602 RepID=UPI0035BE2F3F
MCNLYNITTNQEAIRDLSLWDWSSVGNLEPSLDVYPDRMTPIVRNIDGKRELANVRWGLPSSQKAQLDATSKRADKLRAKGKEVDEAAFADLLRMEPDKGTTNVRNTSSKHWKRWLGIEHRCLVPATSFAEPDWRSGSFSNAWFALSEERPLFFFAGIWVPQWESVRKVKDGLTVDDLYGFLTTDANGIVKPVHKTAMPVILTEREEIETWLTAPWEEAGRLQRPLPDDMLMIVDAPAKVDDEQPEQRTLL